MESDLEARSQVEFRLTAETGERVLVSLEAFAMVQHGESSGNTSFRISVPSDYRLVPADEMKAFATELLPTVDRLHCEARDIIERHRARLPCIPVRAPRHHWVDTLRSTWSVLKRDKFFAIMLGFAGTLIWWVAVLSRLFKS